MFNQDEYDSFIKYLNDDLKENKSVYGLDFLNAYCQEYPPVSFEIDDPDEDPTYNKELINRKVSVEIKGFESNIEKNEKKWLIVEDGKWSLLEKQVQVINKERSKLEQNLSPYELTLIKLPVKKIDDDKREEIEQLYKEKIVTHGTHEEQYKYITRLAESYKFKKGDDKDYINCLLSAGSIGRGLTNKGSYSHYEFLGKYYRSKYKHDEAASYYRMAVDTAIECDEDIDTLILQIKNMRVQYELDSNEAKASEAFIEENEAKIKKSDNKGSKAILYTLGILSDYCQNPSKVAAWAFFLILASTIFYALVGITPSGQDTTSQTVFSEHIHICRVFMDSIYFSIVTFSTLGYGDYSPSNDLSRIMANIEALGGLFFSSLFLVTLVRKYGR
jgi:hypothetical protein